MRVFFMGPESHLHGPSHYGGCARCAEKVVIDESVRLIPGTDDGATGGSGDSRGPSRIPDVVSMQVPWVSSGKRPPHVNAHHHEAKPSCLPVAARAPN